MLISFYLFMKINFTSLLRLFIIEKHRSLFKNLIYCNNYCIFKKRLHNTGVKRRDEANMKIGKNKTVGIVIVVCLLISCAFFAGYQYRNASIEKQITILQRGSYMNIYPKEYDNQIELDIDGDSFTIFDSGNKIDEGTYLFMNKNTFKLTGEKEHYLFYNDGCYTLCLQANKYEGRVDFKYGSSAIRE